MARLLSIFLFMALLAGCSSFQPTKNVWKGTKQLWATYVSPPADVDYEDKGSLSPEAESLSRAMFGVDTQLQKLERVMQNADKPPTQEWLERLFANFPWLSGFAGVKYDGTILGQEPANSLKELDFNYLLHEDEKQKSRALRGDVQPSPLGPEIMLASPLYDGVDFLGIVVAYFDMRSLMALSDKAQDIVVLTPTALLWPGKYDFASTPLAGVDWSTVVKASSQGTCSNSNGTFFYMVRYLGNLPLVFAVPKSGNFQEGSGGVEQGFAYFPPEREKGTPPPVSEERLKKEELARAERERKEAEAALAAPPVEAASAEAGVSPNDLQPGSRDSVLLRKQAARGRNLEERQLEGENVQVERVQRPRRRAVPMPVPEVEVLTELPEEQPSVQRPSPFGPREPRPEEYKRPSPFGPREQEAGASEAAAPTTATEQPATATEQPAEAQPATSEPAPSAVDNAAGQSAPASEEAASPAPTEEKRPATLPGGRPSPFGPR